MDQEKNQAKPPLNLLANILNNSLTSSTKYDQQKAGLETRTCGGCGAARPDGTDLSTCDFCGFEFYKKP